MGQILSIFLHVEENYPHHSGSNSIVKAFSDPPKLMLCSLTRSKPEFYARYENQGTYSIG